MCGIIGYQGNVTVKDLSTFESVLSHRGPDDFGVFFDKTDRQLFS